MSLVDSALNLNHFFVKNCNALLLIHSILLSVDDSNLLFGNSELIGVDNTLADLNTLLLTESMSLHIVGLLLEINKLSVLSIDVSINSSNICHITVKSLDDINNSSKLLNKSLLVLCDLALKIYSLLTCSSNRYRCRSCGSGNGNTCCEVNGNIRYVCLEVSVDSLLKCGSELIHSLVNNLLNLRRNVNAYRSNGLLTGFSSRCGSRILRRRHYVRNVLRGCILRCGILRCRILGSTILRCAVLGSTVLRCAILRRRILRRIILRCAIRRSLI